MNENKIDTAVAVMLSGILFAEQKLGVTFDSDKQDVNDFTIFSNILAMCHVRLKVDKCILVILADQPGPNGQLSCLHSFKIF